MKIVNAQQMRELDRLTVERAGIPWAMLMETAAAQVTEAILKRFNHSVFAVFCGKGNNGGDGAAVARQLWLHGGESVDVFLFGNLDDTRGEARVNFEIIRRLAEMEATSGGGRLTFSEITSEEEEEIYIYHDCLVDALFGTGLTRAADGIYAKAIDSINRAKQVLPEIVTVVSIDIPSGLPSDSANVIGPHVRADLTVSFTAPKLGNVLPPACDANGELVVAPIGTPAQLVEGVDSRLYFVEEAHVIEWLRASRRPPAAHKGSVGDVLVVAGSRGKTGAAVLAAEAVLRAGAGLVTVATSRSAQELLISQAQCEVMSEALDETDSGTVAREAVTRALELAASRTVVAIGPGLSSLDAGTRSFVSEFVAARTTPVVIDADGLNALAPWPPDLKGSDELPIIITPHPGEMARLVGKTNAEVLSDRIGVAQEFAVTRQVITVLKGQRTLVVSPSGRVYVNPTGNAGMATAGAGDVLTGMIAGLIAQQPSIPLEGAIAAVYLHGLAGDIAAGKLGMRSIVASSITDCLPEAILRVGGDAERK